MNPVRDVLVDHWVEIHGDRIVAILAAPPGGIPAIDTGGLIFPGLIDAHNHPHYNVLGIIPFEHYYEHRNEWRSDPIYGEFGSQYDDIMNYGNSTHQFARVMKLAEVRAMCNGTTTLQGKNEDGSSHDAFAREGIGINNAHRMPPHIYNDVFPLTDGSGTWHERAAQNWRRFVIHLAEGTNQEALDEFYTWQSWGMLDGRTTIIHGVPLQAPEWEAMAAVGAHLVWSPVSNLNLYGATADIPGALATGVNVSLAPDWTPSGSNSMLDEMKVAYEWSESEWSGLLTPQILTEIATVNPADALGMSDIRGSIQPGLRADLCVIAGDPQTPYDAAEPALCCFRGLEVFDCHQTAVPDSPPAPASLDVYPNPCNPRSAVSFTLRREEDISVGIFDLAGRRQRMLARRSYPAGEHFLSWDGRDDSGRELASGIYLLRLRSRDSSLTRKVALLR